MVTTTHGSMTPELPGLPIKDEAGEPNPIVPPGVSADNEEYGAVGCTNTPLPPVPTKVSILAVEFHARLAVLMQVPELLRNNMPLFVTAPGHPLPPVDENVTSLRPAPELSTLAIVTFVPAIKLRIVRCV
jgi:hypothetical protein